MKDFSAPQKNRYSVLCAGFAFAMIGCGPTTPSPSDPTKEAAATGGAAIGKPAPEIQAEYVTGQGPKTVAEAKGTVVIVDFWGTYCEPCKKEFPKLQEIVDTEAGKLALIAISQDDPDDVKPDAIKKFGQDFGNVSFPLLWDKQKKSAAAYDVKAMPTSIVIDKKGVIRYVHKGYHEETATELPKEVDTLVAE